MCYRVWESALGGASHNKKGTKGLNPFNSTQQPIYPESLCQVVRMLSYWGSPHLLMEHGRWRCRLYKRDKGIRACSAHTIRLGRASFEGMTESHNYLWWPFEHCKILLKRHRITSICFNFLLNIQWYLPGASLVHALPPKAALAGVSNFGETWPTCSRDATASWGVLRLTHGSGRILFPCCCFPISTPHALRGAALSFLFPRRKVYVKVVL